MTDPAREHPMTEAQYLEFERNSEVRHEFEDGLLWAMAGDKKVNNRIAFDIGQALDPAVLRSGCSIHFSDTRVRTQRGNFYYPDVVVSCPADTDVYEAQFPCVIFEILSESTQTRDRTVKFDAYTYTLPSLEQYLLVSSEERKVEVYTRAEGGIWTYQRLDEAGTLQVKCLDTTLTLEQMYRNVPL